MSVRVSLRRTVVMNCTHGQLYDEYGRVEKRSTAHSKLKWQVWMDHRMLYVMPCSSHYILWRKWTPSIL